MFLEWYNITHITCRPSQRKTNCSPSATKIRSQCLIDGTALWMGWVTCGTCLRLLTDTSTYRFIPLWLVVLEEECGKVAPQQWLHISHHKVYSHKFTSGCLESCQPHRISTPRIHLIMGTIYTVQNWETKGLIPKVTVTALGLTLWLP